MRSVPCSHWMSICTGRFVGAPLVASSTLRIPEGWVRVTVAVSSTSITSPRESVEAVPVTAVTPPSSHCSRSRVWITWLISSPPPLPAQVPRHGLAR